MLASIPTPRRLFRPSEADARFRHIAAAARAASGRGITVLAAYSIKTNPDERLLVRARAHGLLAEAISDEEAAWAERLGFAADRLVYNGPHPPAARRTPLAYCFADSVEAFARNLAVRVADVAGVRLRPTGIDSRFGVPPADDDALLAAAGDARARFAVSLHVRRSDYGGASWRDLCADVLERGLALARERGPLVALDVGGGWDPGQFDALFPADIRWLVARAQRCAPDLRTILIEPGQAVATPVGALLARVVEVRRRPGRDEAIVDAGHGDWPLKHAYRHPVSLLRDGEWHPLGSGRDRLGGATCLEYDLVDGFALPPDLRAGDLLRIDDVGSYDRSMAFPFARGAAADEPPEERAS